MRGYRRRGGRRNFWVEWEDARHVGGSPNEWREFFHERMGDWPEEHWAFGGRRFQPWHKGEVTFNPFVANLFSQRGGLLPIIVLNLLREKPRYGNELMESISQKTSGQWAANPGAVYPLMAELEDRGLVEGQWEDPRKRTVRVYKLTDKGKNEIERVAALVRPKLDEAIEVLQTIVNELNENSDQAEGNTTI
ncbi:MAG: PadR family transcriptional regulator [Anaerolineae bacterium]|nr:PadR family transcriptional regulator [Anaerolineae bacterium]